MEQLTDDLLALIIDKIDDTNDRRSLSQVNKQWLRVEGINRSSLVVFDPQDLPNFLPRFPKLLDVQVSTSIPNFLIQFVADTCPRIRVLNLYYKEKRDLLAETTEEDDMDDVGLCHIANKCRDLETVILRRRSRIGDMGVVWLGQFATKLKTLDLGFCTRVSDDSLVLIGSLTNLEVLNLHGCFLITDKGLGFMAAWGLACKTLKKLNVSECDRITDKGLMHLKDMACLVDLNLSECGPRIMEWGGGEMVVKSSLRNLRRLNLWNLVNVCDKTLIALRRFCKNLEALDLSGCELVTGDGIREFTSHESLKELVLRRCGINICIDDIEALVLGSSSLEYIVLDRRLRSWIPSSVQEENLAKFCLLEWQ